MSYEDNIYVCLARGALLYIICEKGAYALGSIRNVRFPGKSGLID